MPAGYRNLIVIPDTQSAETDRTCCARSARCAHRAGGSLPRAQQYVKALGPGRAETPEPSGPNQFDNLAKPARPTIRTTGPGVWEQTGGHGGFAWVSGNRAPVRHLRPGWRFISRSRRPPCAASRAIPMAALHRWATARTEGRGKLRSPRGTADRPHSQPPPNAERGPVDDASGIDDQSALCHESTTCLWRERAFLEDPGASMWPRPSDRPPSRAGAHT